MSRSTDKEAMPDNRKSGGQPQHQQSQPQQSQPQQQQPQPQQQQPQQQSGQPRQPQQQMPQQKQHGQQQKAPQSNQDQQHQQPQSQPQEKPKQQQQSMPSMDEIKGGWKQQVGAAKIAWGKLTEDELLQSEGRAQRLAGLVQERYAITRDEADKQVKGFFDKVNKAIN